MEIGSGGVSELQGARSGLFRMDALTWLLMAVLVVFVGGAFAPTLKAHFVDLDDQMYVYENPNVLNGLSPHGIKWAVTNRYASLYIPMTWLSLQLDATISNLLSTNSDDTAAPVGPKPMPDATVFHVTNLVLHATAACLLFLLIYRATGNRWAGFVVALLWAVHPMRVESVAWVTERKDQIAGVFGFLAMNLYVVSREKSGRAAKMWMYASCAAFVLSLWGKAMFVTMPALLMILDYWPLGRFKSRGDFVRLMKEKWELWGIAVVGALETSYITRGAGGTLTISHFEMAENAFVSYIRYLVMQVDFMRQAPYFPYVGSPPLEALGAVAILAVVTGVAWWKRGRWPWLLAGWLWFLISLLPMIGFKQIFSQAYADRFTYLPTVGLLMIVVAGLFQWRRATGGIVAGAVALAVVLGVFTFGQTEYWHDSITLFERAQEFTPVSEVAEVSLGCAYRMVGRLEDAERELQKAIAVAPTSSTGHRWLANVYLDMKKPDMGLVEARTFKELSPDKREGNKLYGLALLANGRFDEAKEYLETAQKMDPEDEETRRALAAATRGVTAVP